MRDTERITLTGRIQRFGVPYGQKSFKSIQILQIYCSILTKSTLDKLYAHGGAAVLDKLRPYQ